MDSAHTSRRARQSLPREIQTMNDYFSEIEKWRLPESMLRDSVVEMALDGANGNKGIALWMGKELGCIAEVTHLVLLRGPGVVKEPDLINIDSSVWNDVTDISINNKSLPYGA